MCHGPHIPATSQHSSPVTSRVVFFDWLEYFALGSSGVHASWLWGFCRHVCLLVCARRIHRAHLFLLCRYLPRLQRQYHRHRILSVPGGLWSQSILAVRATSKIFKTWRVVAIICLGWRMSRYCWNAPLCICIPKRRWGLHHTVHSFGLDLSLCWPNQLVRQTRWPV